MSTVLWVTSPPSKLVSGQQYELIWGIFGEGIITLAKTLLCTDAKLSDAVCQLLPHVRDQSNVPQPSFQLQTSQQSLLDFTGSLNTFRTVMTAPPVTTPTPYYIGAHANVDGIDLFSPVLSQIVSPASPQTFTLTVNINGNGQVRVVPWELLALGPVRVRSLVILQSPLRLP